MGFELVLIKKKVQRQTDYIYTDVAYLTRVLFSPEHFSLITWDAHALDFAKIMRVRQKNGDSTNGP